VLDVNASALKVFDCNKQVEFQSVKRET